MSPSNIIPMNTDSITPEVVANEIVEAAPNLEAIYCVAVTKNGEIWTFLSGTAFGCAYAGSVLQTKAINGTSIT